MQQRLILAVVGVLGVLFVLCGTFLQLQSPSTCPEGTVHSPPAPAQPHSNPAAPIPPSLPSGDLHVETEWAKETAGREPEAFDLLRTYWQCPAEGFESLSRSFSAWRSSPFGIGDAHPSDAMDAFLQDRGESARSWTRPLCPAYRLDGLRCFLSKAGVAPDVDFFFWHRDGPPSLNQAPTWGPVPLVSPESNFPFATSQNINTPSRIASELMTNSKALPKDARIGLEQTFEQKQRLAVWRGTTTGGGYRVDNWKDKLRTKLVLFSLQHPDLLDAGFSGFVQISKEAQQEMEAFRFDQGEGKEGKLVAKSISMEEQCRTYRAIVVVDGNSSPDRLARQLACGTSVVLWQISKNPGDEWFSELRPWVHFVPLRSDLSDLEERLRLVLADNPQTVAWMDAIARAGRDFVLHRLSPSMTKCYWLEFLSSLASITPPRSVESDEHSGEGWEKLDNSC
ncbi:Protein O-glucosyltransferase 2 [Balamuthia mandrillaris]